MRNGDADLPLDRSIGGHGVFISVHESEMKGRFADHLYHSLINLGIKTFLDIKGEPHVLEAARRAIIQVPIFTSTYAESTSCLDDLVEMMKRIKSSEDKLLHVFHDVRPEDLRKNVGPFGEAKVLPVFYDVRSEDLTEKDGPFGKAIKAHREKGKRNEETIQEWEVALNDASWREGFRLETYNRCEGELLKYIKDEIVKIKDEIVQKIEGKIVQEIKDSTHDVFISHRGPEMKRKFANQLYCSLKGHGIKTFLDIGEFPKGVDVRPYMVEAARRAIIQVPIFTSIFAESEWCLRELVEMMESTKSPNKAKVFPVFYDVKPEGMRNKDGPLAIAIEDHREKGKDNEATIATIQGWEDALNAASKLKGFELEGAYKGWEGKLSKDLVNKIVQEIKDRTLGVPNAVGLEGRVHDVVELFHLKEKRYVFRLKEKRYLFRLKKKRYVFFFLLWGMGGIGKTALARSIFIRLGKEFQATSFVEKCRDEKLNRIQQSLLNDLLRENNFRGDLRRGKAYLKRGLSQREVLIVLDDVLDFDSIEDVIDLTSLHPGSLILVTSRSHNVYPFDNASSDVFKVRRYEVQGLGDDESLQLLCLNAFEKPSPEPGFKKLAQEVSQACCGLPLSLEVLGRDLRRKKREEMWEDAIAEMPEDAIEEEMSEDATEKKMWEDAIEDLRRRLHPEIEDRLMISYEALNMEEREMFLDVACFMIGQDKRCAEYFWDGLVNSWRTGLENLVHLCLVNVGEDECLTMHDTLRDLGRAIAKKEDKESGNCSRVWDNTDLLQVLKSQQGLHQIRGIVTSLPRLSVGLLSQMRSLRLLFLDKTQLDGDDEELKGLKIRWLKLTYYKGTPKEILDMKFVTALKVEVGANGMKLELPFFDGQLKTLRKLVMDDGCIMSKYFGSLESLEELDVRGSAIRNLPSSFGQLKKLRKLHMPRCYPLEQLPERLRLEQLPEDFGSLESLEELDVRELRITKLPPSFGQLKKLRKLDMSRCKQLAQLPEHFGSLESLEELYVRELRIRKLPPSFGQLKKLRKLDMSRCRQLAQLPEDFGSLESLEELYVRELRITMLPSFWQLKRLRKLDLSECDRLEQLPEEFVTLESLEELDVREVRITKLPSSFGQLKKLRKLDMSRCKQLVQLPEDFGSLESLEELYLQELRITMLPSSFWQLKKLRKLDLSGCEWLEQLPEDFGCLASLEELDESQTPIMKHPLGELEKVA